MWTAILITVVASTGNNIGKALQKSATASLPRLTLDSVVLRRYLSSKEWLLGLAADLGGGLLMIAAVARAPVRVPCSVSCSYSNSLILAAASCCCGFSADIVLQVSIVQPVSGLGLVLLAVFSHFYLKVRPLPSCQNASNLTLLAWPDAATGHIHNVAIKWPVTKLRPCRNTAFLLQERLHKAEWGAVIIATVGTLGLGATAGDSPDAIDAKPLSKLRIGAVLFLLCAILVAATVSRLRTQSRPARRVTRTSATTCGLQVSVQRSMPQRYLDFSALANFSCASAQHVCRCISKLG